MTSTIIADTGPIVAFLDRSDQYHEWSREVFAELTDPLVTCEAVIAEALFLLRRGGLFPDPLLQLVNRGALIPEFRLSEEIEAIAKLMKRYRNVPMSLADACMVRMTETHKGSKVFTLDSDFTIYRKNSRQVIPVISLE